MGDVADITELRLGPPGLSLEGDVGCRSRKRAMETVPLDDENSTTEQGCGGSGRGCASSRELPPPALKGPVVGWPPVCSFRQRNAGMSTKKVFVKVSMDGAPFLRKVELDACCGYDDLTAAVEKLFGIRGLARNGSDAGEFSQIYEDKDGDWMLVGDVPWHMFVTSCRRLRLMKNSEEAKGFGPQLRVPADGKRRM